ncbi:MAG: DUF2911 domain-containing protein [Deinococcales bacterium]|nr:DUF2911 domain-containing protein [Chitinophagaceae bacterium]
MKKVLPFLLFASLFVSTTVLAQDKQAPKSPPMVTEATIASGATIKINYSAPSVKGRVIGKDLEPMAGKIWRTGANDATTFDVNKDVMVEGKALPAGKYSLFTIVNGNEWTIIFNKTAKQWGAYNYVEADDALRVKVARSKGSFTEQFKINATNAGAVNMFWGNNKVSFKVK